ncbi:hypothetical protein [Croceicoccus sp. YJ47]|uniref:hypothetical protein n=1 Tax=Croceicoccus sp. YJ47 TaxID=2798724 RepID=UPI0019228121|nr:hypothetical protein [Croceicoccus sp. YJ47]QQN73881.1 hypothetical protein JD971_14195 [Croceicoccus sp. YJ47]
MALFPTVAAPLVAWRATPLVEQIIVEGFDLSSATFRLEVRDRRDGGQLRAGLNNASNGNEGIEVTGVETIDGMPVTFIELRIDQATIDAMPPAPEAGEDVALVWGMFILTVGGSKFMAFDGPFILKASAIS